MKILLCDDEAVFLEQLYALVKEYMEHRFIECDITMTTEPEKILSGVQSFDIAFLDIQMGELDGISLAKELKRRNSRLALFFITNFKEYQDDAMDLQAFRYFEKPVDVKRLWAGLDRAMEHIDRTCVDIFVHVEGVQRRILADDIMYVTRHNRRVVVETVNGPLVVRESFDELCRSLPGRLFYQVHNSFLVNLHYVEICSYSALTLKNNTRIPIASRKQANFRKFWFGYIERR